MPHYFFDIIDEGDNQRDQQGVALSDGNDLARTATRKAGDLIQAATHARTPGWWLMEVRNEDQEIVGRVSFVVTGFDVQPRT